MAKYNDGAPHTPKDPGGGNPHKARRELSTDTRGSSDNGSPKKVGGGNRRGAGDQGLPNSY